MKKNILVMVLSIIFILGVLIIGIGPKMFYYKVLYFGDRVKVNAIVYIDGEEKDINKDSVVIDGNGVGKTTVTTDNKKLDVSFKGNHYSLYSIDFKVDDYNFRIGITHFNWWDIQEFNVKIYVDTKENTVSFISNGSYISEKTVKETPFNIEDNKDLSEINVISVGIW